MPFQYRQKLRFLEIIILSLLKKHFLTSHERNGSKSLPECDLCHGTDILLCVLGHGYSTEENGHDSGEAERFGKAVRYVGEDQHQGKFQRGRFTQVDMFEELKWPHMEEKEKKK